MNGMINDILRMILTPSVRKSSDPEPVRATLGFSLLHLFFVVHQVFCFFFNRQRELGVWRSTYSLLEAKILVVGQNGCSLCFMLKAAI